MRPLVVDDRFELRELAGEGGMGTVYRALDRLTGAAVAIKMLRNPMPEDVARFAREAQALSALAHPHIVQYVAHGRTDTGEPFLAMEWLDGEGLDRRLARAGLDIYESVVLARRVAQALAAAHARGIVHRDIKPSNLFLPSGDVASVKVLDFGIAQMLDATALTRTRAMFGTLGYMSPEQAGGVQATVGPAADVFALGCILFECLTGQRAFADDKPFAMLAKLFFEEAPRARSIRPDLPAALDELLARLLARDPAARPMDGAAVLDVLDALAMPESSVLSAPPAESAISGTERRIASVLVVRPVEGAVEALRAAGARTAAPLRMQVEADAAGAVAILRGGGFAPDLAALAARCALWLKAALPASRVALVTGREEDTPRPSSGAGVARAAALLDAPSGFAGEGDRGAVRIDEVTRALLDTRFEVAEEGGVLVLLRERHVGEGARTLLGKPTPFVGRQRELRYLAEIVEESLAERRSVAVLVTGPAGAGKSRLRQELLRLLGVVHPELAVIVGRGDPIGAGSAFAVLASAIRGGLAVPAGEPLEVQRDKLTRLAEDHVAPAESARVAAFLGEMMGIPFPDEASPLLAAARQSDAIMAEQIRRAYVDLSRAFTAAHPALLILEDLHWGDAASVKLVDAVLREIPDRPFVVLALARPEVRGLFPGLWAERDLREMAVGALSRRAALDLARSALGDHLDARAIEALVDRAEGNAFSLEELIRAAAEGRGGALPETLLGVVEARLAALPVDARRLLRAGSVFGSRFWQGGVRALLGEEGALLAAQDRFAELVEREILVRPRERRFAGEGEYAFRHELLREAAYATLTERDRVAGHRCAGEWLLGAGELDPVVLAEHFDRGGEGAMAAALYLRAAEQALRGADHEAAIARARRGLSCGPEVTTQGALRAVHAIACFWAGNYADCHAGACQVMGGAAPGSPTYSRALGYACLSAMMMGDHAAVLRLGERLLDVDPAPEAAASIACAYHAVFAGSLFAVTPAEAAVYLERMEQVLAPILEREPAAAAWRAMTRGYWCRQVERDFHGALGHDREAVRLFAVAGDRVHASLATQWAASDLLLLGAFEEARQMIDADQAALGAMSLAGGIALHSRALLCLWTGAADEARRIALRCQEAARAHGDRVTSLQISLLLAETRLACGDTGGAAREVLAMGDPKELPRAQRAALLSLRAEVRLRQGDAAEAVRLLSEAEAESRAAGARLNQRQDGIPLLIAEARRAAGDVAGAEEAIRTARDDLRRAASRIEAPALRRSFLEAVPVNARILALARQWLGE